MSTNFVLAGKYEGKSVNSHNQHPYIGGEPNRYTYLNKANVREIRLAGEGSSNSLAKAAIGTAVFGSGGAALGANVKEIMLEVYWRDGNKSLIKVSSGMYEIILASMFSDASAAQNAVFETKDRNKILYGWMTLLVLVIVCILSFAWQQ